MDNRLQPLMPISQKTRLIADAEQLINDLLSCKSEESDESYINRTDALSDQLKSGFNQKLIILKKEHIESLFAVRQELQRRMMSNTSLQSRMIDIDKRLEFLYNRALQAKNPSDSKNAASPSTLSRNSDEKSNVSLSANSNNNFKQNLVAKIREEINLLEDNLLILIEAEQLASLNLSTEAGTSIATALGINQKKNAESFLKWHVNCSTIIHKIQPLSKAHEVSSRIAKFESMVGMINTVLEVEEKSLSQTDFENKYGCLPILARAVQKSPTNPNTFNGLLDNLKSLIKEGFIKEAGEFCNWIHHIYYFANLPLNGTQWAVLQNEFPSSTVLVFRENRDVSSSPGSITKNKELSDEESLAMTLQISLTENYSVSTKVSTSEEKKNDITSSSATTRSSDNLDEEAMLAFAIKMSMEKIALLYLTILNILVQI